MLKYFTDTPPAIHLGLLIGIPLLWLPALLGGYFHVDESLALLVAEQANSGGMLYTNAWWSGPPLLIWVYEAFDSIFGRNAVIALRIFAMLWVYIMAVYLNGMTSQVKLFRTYPGLPGILFALAVSLTWSELFLSAELIACFFLLLGFNRLLGLKEQAQRNYVLMLEIGIMLSIASLCTFKSLFLLLGVILAYFFLRSPRIDELFALLGGLLIPLFFMAVYLSLNGNGAAFWEIGIQYYFERLGLTGESFYQPTTLSTLPFLACCWAVFIILTAIGFFHFRIRFFSYVVNIRSLETVMALWLMAGLILLALKLRRIEVQDFQLILPSLAFYSARVWDMKFPRRVRTALFLILIPLWGWIYLHGWKWSYPQSLNWLPTPTPQTLVMGSMAEQKLPSAELEKSLKGLSEGDKVWIWDHLPYWYPEVGQAAALPFADFRMFYYKFPPFPPQQAGISVSPLAEEHFYQEMLEAEPDVILDPKNLYPTFSNRYPTLFLPYRDSTIQGIQVYYRPKTQRH